MAAVVLVRSTCVDSGMIYVTTVNIASIIVIVFSSCIKHTIRGNRETGLNKNVVCIFLGKAYTGLWYTNFLSAAEDVLH